MKASDAELVAVWFFGTLLCLSGMALNVAGLKTVLFGPTEAEQVRGLMFLLFGSVLVGCGMHLFSSCGKRLSRREKGACQKGHSTR